MTAPTADPTWSAAAETAAGSVIGLLRTVRKAKAKMLAADAKRDVESASHLLLHVVATEGPLRTSALAASVQSDLSTVSRQSAALVADGLLQRQADPCDGRASLLALTPAGQDRLAEHERGRSAFFADVLDGWTTDELRQFSALLNRFTPAYDQVHDAWIAERAASRPATKEGLPA